MEHFIIPLLLSTLSTLPFVNCNFVSISNMSNISPVSGVTLDGNYATIVYGSSTSNNSNVCTYNVVSNSTISMTASIPYSIKSISQIAGYNNNTNNLYMIQNSTKYTVLTQNMQNAIQNWSPSGNTSYYMTSLGRNATSYYEIVTISSYGNKVSTNINQNSMANNSVLFNQSISNEEGISVLYNNLKIYLVTGVPNNRNTSNTSNIRIYNETLSLIKNISITVSNYYQIKVAVSSSYLAIFTYTQAQIFDINNYTNIYNKTISQYNIVDICITNIYLIMTTDYRVYHYNVTNGQYMGYFDFSFLNGVELRVDVAENGTLTWVCVWYVGGKDVYIFNVTSAFNSTSPVISNNTNTTNITNTTNTIANSTISSNQTQISQQNSSTALNQSQQVMIDKQMEIKITNMLVSLNVVRVNIFQRMYFFIDKLKLHNYHKTQYDGAIKLILDFMNAFQNNCWDLINFGQIMDWINQPFNIPSYQYYTNPKFWIVQNSDSFFLQNTKDYFLLYLPIIVLVFFALNRLFHCISKYKLSKFLRYFSIFLTLIMLLFVQNITMLAFLACHHLKNNMFRFNWVLSFLQAFVIIFIGLCIILVVSFFYLSRFLYKKKSKIFLINLYPSYNSLAIMTMKLTLKPLIQAIIQVFLYNHYDMQILSLCLVDFISFLIFSANQLIFADFKVHTLFVTESVLDLSISFINFLLYLKYVGYPELGQIIQSWIIATLYVIACILLLTVFYQIIETIKMIIRQIKNGKKKKKKVFSQHKFQGRSEKQRSKKGLIVKFAFKGQFKHF